MEQLIGQMLGNFKVESVLGEGGMGAVLKAQDITLQRTVAVKVMLPHLAKQPGFAERFLQEARTAAKLDHPGIVKVIAFDVDRARSLPYIVMEFIPGNNLRWLLHDLARARKWIPLPEALHLVRQASLTLDYAHRQGILHRDIKPDNVMLKSEPSDNLPYRPVITDMGLAKLAEGGLTTRTGVAMGTPAYMSPEQTRGQELDARSDIYSLGIVLYELAVGQRPFAINTPTDAVHFHNQVAPPSPRSLHPDLPPTVEMVILKTLAKNPADRYPSAAALAEALNETEAQTMLNSLPPFATGGSTSLLTEHQRSIVEPRGPSLMDEFWQVNTPPEEGQDRLQILPPNQKTPRTVRLTNRLLIIGRGSENGVVLDDGRVSRQHLKLEFDGQNYLITDLNSTNGSYLDNKQLLPGVAEVWRPDQPLRLGDHYLHLWRGQGPAIAPGIRSGQLSFAQSGGSLTRADGSLVSPSQMRTSADGGVIISSMRPAQMTVEAGQTVTTTLVIMNGSPIISHFEVAVEGISPEWVAVLPPPLRLMPGESQEVGVTFLPPRSPQSTAKLYPLTMKVTSKNAPDQAAEVEGSLTVQPFADFKGELQPQRLRAGQSGRVLVYNRGNAPQTFSLKWQERGDDLAFDPLQAEVTVANGQSDAVSFKANPRRRPFIGGQKTQPFSIQVSAPLGQTPALDGELVSSARFPIWLPLLLLLLCAGLLLAGGLRGWWEFNQGEQQVAATATAHQAATAAAIAARDATATATIEAATATAQVDTDEDGLTDIEEAKLGTQPDLADTDNDGLSDKEEVDKGTEPGNPDTDGDGLFDGDEKKEGTDPQKRDSDGDTLLDGDEVHNPINPTSPVNPDTDKDGLPDNVDPDPRHLPTETPTPTATSTPTITPVPTETPNFAATTQAAAAQTAAAEQAAAQTAAAQAAAQTAAAEKAAAEAAAAQAAANPPINIRADQETIEEGQCTFVRWDVDNVKEIYLKKDNDEEKGIPGHDKEEACVTATYQWRIIKIDGSEYKQTITINVISKVVSPTPTSPPAGFRVVEVILRADPYNYAGPCPIQIVFSGRISVAGGSGVVSYKFIRSDGASGPIQTLNFDSPGSKDVSSYWMRGVLGERDTDWEAIQIFDPQPITSNQASFTFQCQ